MSCSGLHCASCGGAGATVPVVALAALGGIGWAVTHLAEVIAMSAACAVLSVAAVVVLSVTTARREAAYGAVLAVRRETLAASAAPRAIRQPAAPAIEYHVHHHYEGAGESASPAVHVIRGEVTR